MKVGIQSRDESHKCGYYSKVEGLINAADDMGLDYEKIDFEDDHDCDVVINWEPFNEICTGNLLTIVWVWDTHRLSLREEAQRPAGPRYDILFRAHATFYHPQDIDPRGKHVYWMPPAVDPEVFKRNEEIERDKDVVFIGTQRYHPEINILKDNFDCKISWGGAPYEQYVNEYCRGKLLLNVPVSLETNKRVMELMAIGPMLVPWGPDYSLLATPGKHFISYLPARDDNDVHRLSKDLCETVNYYLEHDDERKKIARAGRQLVLDRFTFKHQVRRIETVLHRHIDNDGHFIARTPYYELWRGQD